MTKCKKVKHVACVHVQHGIKMVKRYIIPSLVRNRWMQVHLKNKSCKSNSATLAHLKASIHILCRRIRAHTSSLYYT